MLESDCRPGSRCFRASRTGRARLWSCLAGALAIALHVPGAEVQAAEADGFPPAAESIQEPGASSGIGAAQVSEADSRSEEHTSELQSLMSISYAVFCLKKKTIKTY